MINSVTVEHITSDGAMLQDLTNITIYRDADVSGSLSEPDYVIGGPIDGHSSTIIFLLSFIINKPERFIITADVVGGIPGAKHRLRVSYFDAEDQFSGADVSGYATGDGQIMTIGTFTHGQLLVHVSSGMPLSKLLHSGMELEGLAEYTMYAFYEEVVVTDLPIYLDTYHLANIERFYLFWAGDPVGSTSGYAPDPNGTTWVHLEAGEIIVPKGDYRRLVIAVDTGSKYAVWPGDAIRIGIGDSNGDDSQWDDFGSYAINAFGASSGMKIPEYTIDSMGDGTGMVFGSNQFYIYRGILKISLNEYLTPGGLQSAGTMKSVLVFDLEAFGDEIRVDDLEFFIAGIAEITGTGAAYLKNYWNYITYAEWPAGTTPWLNPGNSFSVSHDASGFINPLIVPEGSVQTVMLMGDTNGATTNDTLQVSIDGDWDTTSGIVWHDSSGLMVDSMLTASVPVVSPVMYF